MKKETIAEETRRYFNYLKLKVMESDEPVYIYEGCVLAGVVLPIARKRG